MATDPNFGLSEEDIECLRQGDKRLQTKVFKNDHTYLKIVKGKWFSKEDAEDPNFGLSDKDIERLRQGDKRLETKVFDGNVHTYLKIVKDNGFFKEDAEEIVSDAFAKMFRRLTEGLPILNLSGYVYTIVTNECKKLAEKKKDDIVVIQAVLPVVVVPQKSEDFRIDMLDKCFKRLCLDCQNILKNYYWEGKRDKEIGKELGITEDTAKHRRWECIKKLRNFMGGK